MLKGPNLNPPAPYEMITLAGQPWPIPLLAPRQNRIVEPGVWKLMRDMTLKLDPKVFERVANAQTDEEKEAANVDLGKTLETLRAVEFKTEQYDLLVDVITAALSRAHPTVTRDDVLDMVGLTTRDMMASLVIIARQTGTMKAKKVPEIPPAPLDGQPTTGDGT